MASSSTSRSGEGRSSIQTYSSQTTQPNETRKQVEGPEFRPFFVAGLKEFFKETDPDNPEHTDPEHTDLGNTEAEHKEVEHTDLDASQVAEKKDKKRGAARFMTKLFGRSSTESSKKPTETGVREHMARGIEESEPVTHGIMDTLQAAPFLNPLQYRLQPRKEDGELKPPKSIANLEAAISPITIARNRGEAARLLFGCSDQDNVEYDLNSNKVQTVLEAVMSGGVGAPDVQESTPDMPEERLDSPTFDSEEQADIFKFHDLEDVILALSPDDTHLKEWRCYMDCYSKGQFNLIDPPPPPTLNSRFEFLPSVYPPGEPARLFMSSQYDVLWPFWGQDKAGALIRIAMKKFGTKFASLSFFDEENEIFKAENGYNQSHIERTVSIAAHCLLSKDVLVVLDTKQDWRFADNPLVAGRPKIRFFAGAPMMSLCGEVLGVFAIFASRPRKSFTPLERRELAEFSSLVMTDLRMQAERLSDMHLRSTPILDRESVINAPYQPRSIKSFMDFNGLESELVPPALSYHKAPQRPKFSLPIAAETQDVHLYPVEPTPPSSSESNIGFFANASGYTNGYGHHSGNSSASRALSPQESTSMPHGLRASSPRPFSSSDLTSLHPHPPNTPAHSIGEEELSTKPQFHLTVEDFLALTDEDCAESYRQTLFINNQLYKGYAEASGTRRKTSDLEEKAATSFRRNHSKADNDSIRDNRRAAYIGSENIHAALVPRERSDLLRSVSAKSSVIRSHKAISGEVPSHMTPFTDSVSGVTSTPLIDLRTPPTAAEASEEATEQSLTSYSEPTSSRMQERSALSAIPPSPSLGIEGRLAEAALACASNALSLGYDLVYAVEISPMRPFMSDEELFAQHGLRKKILVAYGLTQPLELASETHVRVLRCRGYEHWENKRANYEEGEYQSGCLIPLASEGGQLQLRSSGIIMGAFRKPRPAPEGLIRSSAAEMVKLLEFSEKLKDTLLRKPRKQQTRPNTEPVTCSAYPANEAREVEVGKYSFDAARNRRY